MSSILSAWQTGRPIYSRLPNRNGIYENDTSDWVTAFWDAKITELRTKIDDIKTRQINPLICDPEWLDYLSVIYGWNSKHWQKSWAVESKRLLLSRSLDFIWERKGNREVLVYVLESLNLKAKVIDVGDFIIGVNPVGDELGVNTWKVKIIMPTVYEFINELEAVKYIVLRFAPCWIEIFYIFDDSFFTVAELLEITDSVVLGDNPGNAIEI